MPLDKNTNKYSSLYSLIIVNLLVIFLALFQHWSIFELMFVYWSQSVIIGIFNFFRILGLENYSVEGFKENGKTPPANKATKIRVAIFFAFHYGAFNIAYLVFLFTFKEDSVLTNTPSQFFYLLLGVGSFFFNHLLSFQKNKAELKSGLNIGKIMFLPYIRIIPMHLVIVFFGAILKGGSINPAMYGIILIVFLGLKTLADIAMHLSEHKHKKIPEMQI